MFSKFKLNGLQYSDFKSYEEFSRGNYELIKEYIQKSLEDFIGSDGVISGTELQNSWFPTNQNRTFNVFLSHSHNDEKLAIALAGFLEKELKLNTFIDSCLWGYSNDLLRKIDEKYCIHSNGESFDYDKRNYSTSHVHMMLSIALSRMIDNCEAIFFLNSENSISLSEEIEKKRTSSPWIYNELSLADTMRIKPINEYRDFSNIKYDIVNESTLDIKYDVDDVLKEFISLSYDDLISCKNELKKKNRKFQSSLDYIYLSKNIIK